MRRRDFLKIGASVSLAPSIPVAPFATKGRLLPTGIMSLDEALGGGMPPGLILVTGKTGSGKSTFLRRIHKAGRSRHVSLHVRKAGPVVCPLTGVRHYFPERLFYDQFDRPISLIDDDVLNLIGSYAFRLRERLYREFLQKTRIDNERDNRLAIITLPVNERDGLCGIPACSLSATFYSSIIIRLHRLDAQGRGRIQITKNRNTDFLGGLVI